VQHLQGKCETGKNYIIYDTCWLKFLFILNKNQTDLIERFDTFQAENEKLKAQLSQQDKKILLLEKEIFRIKSVSPKPTDSCSKRVSKVASENKASTRAFTSIPTSCDELRTKGHFANGVYLVLNEETNKIDAVLCQFLGAKQSKVEIFEK